MDNRYQQETEQELEEQFLGALWNWATGGKPAAPSGTPVSRSSSTYIRWVQQSLNKVLGLKLAVDGDMGPKTRSAVRDFQRRAGLAVDGKVGSNTEKALVRAGAGPPPATAPGSGPGTRKGPLALVSARLPRSGTGYITTNNDRKYGIPETVQALQAIARAWRSRHPEVVMRVGDISKEGGGKISGHASHRLGLDADIHLLVDGQRINSQDSRFPQLRRYVEAFAQVVRDNPVLPVKYVWFQDKKRRTKNVNHIKKGHTTHLHIRFCRPPAYRSQLNLDKVYAPGEKRGPYDCKR